MLPDTFEEILRVEVGSTVHGINVAGTDDVDELGVCVEPPEFICGLQHFEQHQFRTAWARTFTTAGSQPQPKSQAGDIDRVIYSLRKWCRLAVNGNPTALMLLYSPKMVVESRLGDTLRELAPAFSSKKVVYAFAGYMHDQKERLEGKRGQQRIIRTDLIQAHGFDTKYAAHVIRLGIQGDQFATSGRLVLPMAPVHTEFLRAVRLGKVPFAEVIAQINLWEWKLNSRIKQGEIDLPDEPDHAAVDAFLIDAYQTVWKGKPLAKGWAKR